MQQSRGPTWGDIKKLTADAQWLALSQDQNPSLSVLFVAFLSILSINYAQVSAEKSNSYWAFFPNPPSFQPVA